MQKFLALAAVALLSLAGCNQNASRWADFQNAFIERAFEIDPTFGAGQGRHEYDGRLPDWSETGLTTAETFLRESITQAEAMRGLNPEQTFQRDYLVAVARGQLFWLDTADQPHTNPAYYMGALSPSMYVARPYAAADVRLRAYIQYLRAVPAAAQQIRANLRTPMPLTFVNYGRASFGGLADYYQGDGKAAFAEVTDATLQSQLTEASNAASTAMRELSDWVEAQRATANNDFALGAERFSQMLRDTEMVDLPLAEIERIGREDLARNQTAMREACAQFAPGATIPQCMARMGAHKPEGGSVEGARAQLAGLRQFIIDHNLVTIPGTGRRKSPKRRRSAGRTSPTSTFLAPTRRTCRRSITSRRRTHRGPRKCNAISCPAKPNFFSSPRTKSGPATSSTSCTPIAPKTNSAASSLATPTPRAGRTTPKR